MGWITHLAVFWLIWWISLFLVLPLWVQRDANVQAGNDPGAPAHARIGLKLIVNTLLALLIWFGIYLIDRYDLITIKDFSG